MTQSAHLPVLWGDPSRVQVPEIVLSCQFYQHYLNNLQPPLFPPLHPIPGFCSSTRSLLGEARCFQCWELCCCLVVAGLLLLLHLHLFAKFHTHLSQCQFEHSSAWSWLFSPSNNGRLPDCCCWLAGGEGEGGSPGFPMEKFLLWTVYVEKKN